MSESKARYDVIQPYSFQKDGKEITKWQRVGVAFPKFDEGKMVGFTLRFTNSPPFPPMVVVAVRKERVEGKTQELDFDKEDGTEHKEDIPF